MFAVDLFCPFDIVPETPVVRTEAADIEGPDVEARFPLHDPFGYHPSGPASGGDPEGVEADGDKTIFNSGAGPSMQLPSGVKASGPLTRRAIPVVPRQGVRLTAAWEMDSK